MDFRVGGRCCGKTTYLRKKAVEAARSGKRVQIIVPYRDQVNIWVPDADLRDLIEVVPVGQAATQPPHALRFVDDAELVLAQLLRNYDIAVASGRLFDLGEQ